MNYIRAVDVLQLRSLYERVFDWKPVKSAPQPSKAKRLAIDGAGIFWREGRTIYRMQYGAMEYASYPTVSTAEAVLEFIGEHFT